MQSPEDQLHPRQWGSDRHKQDDLPVQTEQSRRASNLRGCSEQEEHSLSIATAPAASADQFEQSPSNDARWEPTIEEVLASVRSLYLDGLKPFGRILLKRLRERASERFAPKPVPLIDPLALREVCERCPEILVEHLEAKEFAALLSGTPSCGSEEKAGDEHRHSFVDACSSSDPYPESLWEEAAIYFKGLEQDRNPLPSGRYDCARVLISRDLPFLSGLSLGEVCHIVQLAISKHELLGYVNGALVPYTLCKERKKAQSASGEKPLPRSFSSVSGLLIATWHDLSEGLKLLLSKSQKPAPGVITVSNVKRQFRSELNLELKETALGHARLLDMLMDDRLRDICWVEGLPHGQALVHRVVHSTEQPDSDVAGIRPPAHPLLTSSSAFLCTSPSAPTSYQSRFSNPQVSCSSRVAAAALRPSHSIFVSGRKTFVRVAGPPGGAGIATAATDNRLLEASVQGTSSVNASCSLTSAAYEGIWTTVSNCPPHSCLASMSSTTTLGSPATVPTALCKSPTRSPSATSAASSSSSVLFESEVGSDTSIVAVEGATGPRKRDHVAVLPKNAVFVIKNTFIDRVQGDEENELDSLRSASSRRSSVPLVVRFA